MNKALKICLIALLSALTVVFLCVGLYHVGYLDVFLFFVLIPCVFIAAIVCFAVSLVSMMRLKREGRPIPNGKKVMLAISGVVLLCVLMSAIALVFVFAMAIAFM